MRVLLVEDDLTAAHGVSLMLKTAGAVVEHAETGEEAIELTRHYEYDIVLLDVILPDVEGYEVVRRMRVARNDTPVLILSGRSDIPTAVEAIRNGASDFIEKRLDADTIVSRVREAIDRWTDRRQSSEIATSSFPGYELLTRRERDVLFQITAAASNKEAAKNLGISRRTVEIHRGHIMRKLGARNTVHLVRIALNNLHSN